MSTALLHIQHPNNTHTIVASVNYPVEVPYRSDEIPDSTFRAQPETSQWSCCSQRETHRLSCETDTSISSPNGRYPTDDVAYHTSGCEHRDRWRPTRWHQGRRVGRDLSSSTGQCSQCRCLGLFGRSSSDDVDGWCGLTWDQTGQNAGLESQGSRKKERNVRASMSLRLPDQARWHWCKARDHSAWKNGQVLRIWARRFGGRYGR